MYFFLPRPTTVCLLSSFLINAIITEVFFSVFQCWSAFPQTRQQHQVKIKQVKNTNHLYVGQLFLLWKLYLVGGK